MRYRVKGAIRTTAEDVEIAFDAADEESAMAMASRMNLLVESVGVVGTAEPENVAACQGCGIVVEDFGALRILSGKSYCPACYGRRLPTPGSHEPWTSESLKSLGLRHQYDEFTDLTTVEASAGGSFRITISATFRGRSQTDAISELRLLITFSDERWTFPSKKDAPSEVLFLMDRTRRQLRIEQWLRTADELWRYETGIATIPASLLAELVKATEVKVKCGDRNGDYSEFFQRALGALCQLLDIGLP